MFNRQIITKNPTATAVVLLFSLVLVLALGRVLVKNQMVASVAAINVKSQGAKGDNVANDTVAIQNAIKAAGSGGTVYFPRGTYRISTAISPISGQTWTGDAMDASIIRQTATAKDAIFIGSANNTLITKLQVRDITNSGVDNESRAIHVSSGQNNIIEYVKIVNSDDAGVRFGHSNGTVFSKNNILRYSRIENTKEGAGIELIKADSPVIHDNYITGSSQYGIRINGTKDAQVYNNEFVRNTYGINFQGYNGLGGSRPVTNAKVHHNRAVDNTTADVYLFNDVRDSFIENNRIGYTSSNSKVAVKIRTDLSDKPVRITVRNNQFFNIGGATFSSTNGLINLTGNVETATEPTATWKMAGTVPTPEPTPVPVPIPEPQPILTFRDVPQTHWASSNIERAATLKIVNGYPDGTFKPDVPITRAEVTTIAVRLYDMLKALIG